MDRKAEARPLLRRMIVDGPWRPRTIGAAMYLDSYLNTNLAHGLRTFYSRVMHTG